MNLDYMGNSIPFATNFRIGWDRILEDAIPFSETNNSVKLTRDIKDYNIFMLTLTTSILLIILFFTVICLFLCHLIKNILFRKSKCLYTLHFIDFKYIPICKCFRRHEIFLTGSSKTKCSDCKIVGLQQVTGRVYVMRSVHSKISER